MTPIKGRVSRTLTFNLAWIGLLVACLLFLLLGAVINKSFTALEDRDLQGHLDRVTDFQKSNLLALNARSKDWGIWDDSYAYAQDFNAGFLAKNVNAESFKNAMVDGLAIVRFKDGAVRSFSFDRASGKEWPALASALQSEVLKPDFISEMRVQDAVQRFAAINGQLFTFAAVQIRQSDGRGTPPGFLAFVQKIDSNKVREALQVPANIEMNSNINGTIVTKKNNSLWAMVPFRNPDGRSVATIKLHLPRPLNAAAHELVTMTFGGVLLLILIMLALLSRSIKALVLDPVQRLHTHVEHIRETGELHALNGPAPDNEFGALQEEFNSMAREMQQLRSQLESQSFTLGKSQSAVGVMHNLRNCLSPVRVILEALEKEVTTLLPAQAPRALKELTDLSVPQDRRDKLVAFLEAAHEQVGAKGALQHRQVREAARNLMNALTAIDTASQDRRDITFDERCNLAGLLSHSGNIVRYAEGAEVSVDTECDGQLAASGNRVLLSQVLENLVTNALESIREAGRTDGFVLLGAAQEPEGDRCRITIVDNGAGFDPHLAKQLFERGFSTRTGKSGGLGLHWCANTVRAMSGDLTLESSGTGHGARATITLPIWVEKPSAQAAAA